MIASPSRNGTLPPDVRSAVELYLHKGLAPIPLPPRSKVPVLNGWPGLRLTAADLDLYFPDGTDGNVGILLGTPSRGLLDVDLDSPEALAVADVLLPPTGWVSGREGSPRSHRWYESDDPPDKAQEAFTDPLEPPNGERKMLVELRSTGGQTVAPPSFHPSGESICWYEFTEPARVASANLLTAVAKVASVALLARHWPKEGCRQDLAMGLAGGLLRGGWDEDAVKIIIRAAATAASDDEIEMRVKTVTRTAKRLGAGKKVRGWPVAARAMGDKGEVVVTVIRDWLGLRKKKDKGENDQKDRRSVATKLIELAVGTGLELFHNADQTGFATLPASGHKETWPLRSTGFRRWLSRIYYLHEEKSASGQAILDALGVLEGKALFDGPEHSVHVRVAEHQGKVYLDLCDHSWKVVEVGPAGWRVAAEAPVKFRRTRGMLALPEPQRNGKLDNLRPYINVADDNGWFLLLGFLVAALRPRGPFPALTLTGEQGTCKSTLGRLVQNLVDPNVGELRCEPKDARDLMIAAGNSWLVCYDNLSHLPQWLSDALCRLATGGGFGTRQLFTDDEEVLFNAQRPAVLSSITDVVTAGDLLDRSLALQLEPIPKGKRRTEAALWAAFKRDQPKILGALLDLVAAGLRTLPTLRVPQLPRMADFALWAEACLRGVGFQAGAFLKAYEANRGDVNVLALEASPVATVLFKALESAASGSFEGEAAELLNWLNGYAEEATKKQKGWPTRPHLLSGQLRRMAPNLRRAGVDVSFTREGHARRRIIRVKREEKTPEGASAASSPDKATEQAACGDETCDDPAADGGTANAGPASVRGTHGERPHAATESAGESEADAPRPRGGRSEGEPASAPNRQQVRGLYDVEGEADGADAPRPVDFGASELSMEHTLVRDAAGLQTILQALDESDLVGLDTETTGLDPRVDRVRLIQLGTDRGVYLVDCFAVDPRPLFDLLAEKDVVGHNAVFDLGFLGTFGFTPGRARDTMLLSQLLHGLRQKKGFHGLADAAEREFGTALDKSERQGDWSGELTPAQLDYAARDAAVLVPLYRSLAAKVDSSGQRRVAEIERRCLPAISWLCRSGVPFDLAAWNALAKDAAAQAARLADRLDAEAPAESGLLLTAGAVNWSSPVQVVRVFARLGITLKRADDAALAAVDHPLAEILRDYRAASKLATTYGEDWIKNAYRDGRLYVSWKQIGADSGRMACSAPNLQNLPRDRRYRACFRAPEGRVLVKADYSQIELRIAAKVSGDAEMTAAYGRGEDLHARTARSVLGISEVSKEHRQLAKALNFGLLYGMGAKGFRDYARNNYGVDLRLEEAESYRAAFFRSYPGLAAWHRRVGESGDGPMETRTLTGRRREKVTRFTEKLNLPVQGTGADGLKLALALLWERRGECPDAVPVLAVHDEIVVECDADKADAAATWLRQAMLDGMRPLIEPVPVEVEVRTGTTWAGS